LQLQQDEDLVCPPMADLPVELQSSTAALLDGKILLCGGENDNGLSSKCFQYDPSINEWNELDVSLPGEGAKDLKSSVIDGKRFISGGQPGFEDTFVY